MVGFFIFYFYTGKDEYKMILDALGRRWYKGNLHAHTTLSDGKMSPEDCISLYREKGYDFLALTDHWHWGAGKAEKDFLLLSGVEYNIGGADVLEGVYHIVAAGMRQPAALVKDPSPSAQQIIDAIHQEDGLAILAHPAWSLNISGEVMNFHGFDGTEIYNTVSGVPWNARPYSGQFVDELACRGYYLPCMAADDVHFYNGDQTRSYLMVQAEELSRESILAAIRKGNFYATQGPRFESVSVKDGVVKVECSPVRDVVFYSNAVYSKYRVTRGEKVTHAEYPLMPSERYVRIELVDQDGRTAWSSPIPMD